jgi:general secretion pathway protein C
MLDQHVFGEAGSVPVQESKTNIDAPETKLSLELQGVSVGKDDSSSSAIISESKGGVGNIFWVGDSISGKAVLNSVFEDRVVIKQNGKLETLRFSDDFKSTGFSPSTNHDRSNEPSNHADVLRSYRDRKTSKNNMVRELGSALNDVNKGDFSSFDSLLDEYGSKLEENLERAARTAGLKEVDDGVAVGQNQKTWMNQVGLEPGDVIKTVNNYPVTSLKSDRSAINSVIKSCLARIEVQRGANTFVVTYPFCN